jgi:hypothetical protein
LEILDRIGRAFGGAALFEIGYSVPQHATFPPHVDGVLAALRSLDAAFHMNHRRDGAVMFDPAAGTMLEGIGHYRCSELSPGRARCESTSVYRCEFDLGILSGLAGRFAPAAEVSHAPEGSCRGRGAESCTYLVSW